MRFLSLSAGFLAGISLGLAATGSVPVVQEAELAVNASTIFPNSELGIKLVNGYPTKANITFINSEASPVTAHLIGGTLTRPGTEDVIRNLTAKPVDLQIAPGGSRSLTYSFVDEITPQDVYIHLFAVLMSEQGTLSRLTVYNGTASIVEAPLDIFDPQMLFLYLFVGAFFASVGYYSFKKWVAPLFPAKRVTAPPRVLVPISKVDKYDESWIPKAHQTAAGSGPNRRKARS